MKEPRGFKKYEQLLKVRTGKTLAHNFQYERYIVVSKTIDGKISMAQQMRVPDYEGNPQFVFLKNSFIFETMKVFEEFRKKLFDIKLDLIKDEEENNNQEKGK